jgi:hypothetical protein
MQPLPSDILRGVLENLEELVFPQVEGAHAKSVAKCTRILINHVILRLEKEPELLAEDNREKRELLTRAANEIESGVAAEVPSVAQLVPHLRRVASTVSPDQSLPALTDENDGLKAEFLSLLQRLHAERSALGDAFESLRKPLRAQLRAQMEREQSLVAPAFGSDPFPF